MFVKHSPPHLSRLLDADWEIYEVVGRIEFGSVELPNTSPDKEELEDLFGVGGEYISLYLSPDNEGDEMIRAKYVVFFQDGELLKVIVTTGDLYILGPDGATIDRVK